MFKVKRCLAWECWMTDGIHFFTKWATYATERRWIVGAWAQLTPASIVKAFMKGAINVKPQASGESDSDNDERNLECWTVKQLRCLIVTLRMKTLMGLWQNSGRPVNMLIKENK